MHANVIQRIQTCNIKSQLLRVAQYALANITRCLDNFPDIMQFPGSEDFSKGIHLIVALVSFFILSSVSMVPSQCAETNPPWVSIIFLKSS